MSSVKFKEEVRKTVFMKAKRDTYIYRMNNMDHETEIPAGTLMFHIVNKNETKYLEPDEVCLYLPEHGTCFSYRPDWDHEVTICDV